MEESILQQIYSKLSNYILKLIDQLTAGTIKASELPLSSLQPLITEHFQSFSQYLNPTAAFHENVMCTLSLLQKAIHENNSQLCRDLLELLLSQLKAFVLLETSWSYTIEYNRVIDECDLFSRQLWEAHTLPKLPHGRQFTGKGVVYTAIIGEYDSLHTPECIHSDWDYICFTDNQQLTSDIWDIRSVNNPENLDPIRLARRHKILCHEYLDSYDYSIWVDGKIQITGDLSRIPECYHMFSPMLCMPHYERDCAYTEAEQCILQGKGNPNEIRKQIQKYRTASYPEHNGLVESCILFRVHHSDSLKAMLQTWWQEIEQESTRDQLSLGYACWKTGFDYDLCNFSIYHNPYFSIANHNQ